MAAGETPTFAVADNLGRVPPAFLNEMPSAREAASTLLRYSMLNDR